MAEITRRRQGEMIKALFKILSAAPEGLAARTAIQDAVAPKCRSLGARQDLRLLLLLPPSSQELWNELAGELTPFHPHGEDEHACGHKHPERHVEPRWHRPRVRRPEVPLGRGAMLRR